MTGHHTLQETEQAIQRRLGDVPLRHDAMMAVSNIYRAAAAIRQHFESSVLRGADLTWTSFVVLWVVWIWEEMETRHVAEEAGISKGTLTGVVKTLEGRGLIERGAHARDGRLVLLRLTDKGQDLMRTLFPAFNAEEAFVVERLDGEENRALAQTLRSVVEHLEEEGDERRAALRADSPPPPPRRSGRRPRS
ncbi:MULTISPECIES: MarR family winged helix-turn-helix transcriptional regulator [Actinomadura]|uniref:MarR family transcriptional regulator n=1 Tax=Actinomadura litoris TaxID=2678616 RepID=A0A7K1L331_9ACTN|nr:MULTISPECIES: MarR family winged helix-turn-helix transcriptional regulator [Actinomadura]MBT2213394.1 MarR family winged helix-turn-helix transcriptional regulator [Actinomadura sp. NEAU-AAG7]MUN38830.1 MarR family transcriptional regulator [Actinomadura litoris]